ncbi:MAG: hypothetical protein ACFCUS_00660 [Rubrimonas sp.]|uniref:hypothetical protein n=1 Tax=Rubrimonas sp. TaxID=2036015 RepID=UPI002FDD4287
MIARLSTIAAVLLALTAAPAPAQEGEAALRARIAELEAQAARDAETIAALRARIEEGIEQADPGALRGRLQNLTLENQELRSLVSRCETDRDRIERALRSAEASLRGAEVDARRARDEARDARRDADRARSDARYQRSQAARCR